MAKFTVKYTMEFTQEIDWPDDELDSVNYDSMLCNLNHEESSDHTYEEIIKISKDDIDFDFE